MKMTIDTLSHHLRVVSERYKQDAQVAREAGHKGIAETFDRQEKECADFADGLEAGRSVGLASERNRIVIEAPDTIYLKEPR
jgi:hypothetical protein